MVKRALLSTLLLALAAVCLQAQTFTIPAGTMIHSRLTQPLSTKLNVPGDTFTATVTEPYIVNGQQVIPAGSTLHGRVAELFRPGRVRGVGEMRLTVDQLTFPDGRTYPLNAVLLSTYGAEGVKVDSTEGDVTGPSSRISDLKEVGMGMGGGGFLGTLFGGFHGAVIGGAIGGGAALVDTLRKRGQDLSLPTGTQLNYQLTRELVVGTTSAQSAATAPATTTVPGTANVQSSPNVSSTVAVPATPNVHEETLETNPPTKH